MFFCAHSGYKMLFFFKKKKRGGELAHSLVTLWRRLKINICLQRSQTTTHTNIRHKLYIYSHSYFLSLYLLIVKATTHRLYLTLVVSFWSCITEYKILTLLLSKWLEDAIPTQWFLVKENTKPLNIPSLEDVHQPQQKN